MLNLYRTALRLRRTETALGDGDLRWSDGFGPDVLAFNRHPSFACVVNLSTEPVALPEHRHLLLASGPLTGDLVPSDTTVWLRIE
jgi:alpha-glucosidase